ncbi:MAG: hypothetical protein PHP45_10575 [Elusimicrobiales bacterium]|nr:hypothetical protein [Elusimicrobiales bacterium]
MKKLMAMAVLATVVTGGAAYANSNYDALFAKEGGAVRVCGKLQVDKPNPGEPNYEKKSLAMTDYNATCVLVIDEVAQPKGLKMALIQYESAVLGHLKEGKTYCAIGIKGATKAVSSYDTRMNLLDFAIVGEVEQWK